MGKNAGEMTEAGLSAQAMVGASVELSAQLHEVAERIGGARGARWLANRAVYRPEVELVRDAQGELIAAVLTSARPATAATKIVDLWFSDADAGRHLLTRVVDAARERDDVAVKWEIPESCDVPAFAHEFVAMRLPWAAVGTENVRGLILWLHAIGLDRTRSEPGYYAQTTLYTCGSVAALIAADAYGRGAFSGADDDREHEIEFWRRASNYPACEPVGLAVALHERVRSASADVALEVTLDHDGPVLLEDMSDFEYDFRAELQAESRRQAHARGIPLRGDRVSVDEVARRVQGGELALLLIDEAPMHGETGPHWITAHEARDDVVLVQDPWVTVTAGETWVDTHDMPVRKTELERLMRWGPSGYRGVVFAGAQP